MGHWVLLNLGAQTVVGAVRSSCAAWRWSLGGWGKNESPLPTVAGGVLEASSPELPAKETSCPGGVCLRWVCLDESWKQLSFFSIEFQCPLYWMSQMCRLGQAKCWYENRINNSSNWRSVAKPGRGRGWGGPRPCQKLLEFPIRCIGLSPLILVETFRLFSELQKDPWPLTPDATLLIQPGFFFLKFYSKCCTK